MSQSNSTPNNSTATETTETRIIPPEQEVVRIQEHFIEAIRATEPMYEADPRQATLAALDRLAAYHEHNTQ